MQWLDTQPNTIQREPEEIIAPVNRKRTARAVGAHQLSTLCVALHKYVENSLRNDALSETHARLTHTRGQHLHVFGCKTTRTRSPFP